MDHKELEAKVIETVAMVYGREAAGLTADTSFKYDLKGVSIQMVGLISELENELDVMIALQDASVCATIGQIIDLVEKELS
ncbi:MAG: acyl carrier protein [Christensenellales bacterium]|jgi:acyl carrier protein